MDAVKEIRERGLKVTPARVKVLKLLSSNHLAFSHTDLETRGEFDRITLYRILNDFESVGLVHKVIDMEGITRFAVCRQGCPGNQHNDNHAHFNCKGCHKMYCLEKVSAQDFSLPPGYSAIGLSTVIYGLCKECN